MDIIPQGIRGGSLYEDPPNADQRNVFIWASEPPSAIRHASRLIAGFYNRENLVTYKTVYEWLDLVLVGGLGGQEVRIITKPASTELASVQYSKRPPGSPKEKKPNRSRDTRENVRARDGWCRVRGDPPAIRGRGSDYTALEVAHIFPVGKVEHAVKNKLLPNNIQQIVGKTFKEADMSANAMMIGCDLHTCYDSYQWGVLPQKSADGQTYLKVYTFEKTLPACLNNLPDTLRDSKAQEDGQLSPNVPEVSHDLLREQFRNALLFRVVRGGPGISVKSPGVISAT
ncbi:hypothetical protein C8Q76DRAFT_838722 [Earliella scabrosa]|nr:hypothetical protein C8Q76DRAFT_838722 [Earliella scabrosa]